MWPCPPTLSLLEEYLRSSESQAKTLREVAGLTEATQKVSDPGTGLLGYENHVETNASGLRRMEKEPASITNAASNLLPELWNGRSRKKNLKEWMDSRCCRPTIKSPNIPLHRLCRQRQRGRTHIQVFRPGPSRPQRGGERRFRAMI